MLMPSLRGMVVHDGYSIWSGPEMTGNLSDEPQVINDAIGTPLSTPLSFRASPEPQCASSCLLLRRAGEHVEL